MERSPGQSWAVSLRCGMWGFLLDRGTGAWKMQKMFLLQEMVCNRSGSDGRQRAPGSMLVLSAIGISSASPLAELVLIRSAGGPEIEGAEISGKNEP